MVAIGIPEALHAVEIILDIAIKLKNESKELARIEKKISKVKKYLSLIDSRMKDKKHPLGQADGTLKSMLEDDCKDIKSGCSEAKRILSERARMHSFEWGSRYLWITYRIPTLNDILANFTESCESIDRSIAVMMLDLAKKSADKSAQKKNAEQLKKSNEQTKKLNEKIEKLVQAQKEERKAREERSKQTARLLKLLEEQGKQKVQDVALGKGDGKKAVDEWVDELAKGGMEKKNARASIKKTLSAVRSESQSQQKILKRAATDEIKKGAVTPKPNPMAKQPEAAQKDICIMCVDSTNGALSIMAQTYLELVRAWTVNTQKRWLFERVHSVGIQIPTSLTKSTLEADKLKEAKSGHVVKDAPITVLAGKKSYFETNDPDEKGTILKRMREHKTSGLSEEHFQTFHYMICFDEQTRNFLEKMKGIMEAKVNTVKIVSKIHQLDCGSLNDDDDENAEVLQKTAGRMKVALKRFLKGNFEWEKPAIGITDGEWRTLQILVSKETEEKLKKDSWSMTEKVFKKKGCQVKVANDVDNKYVISISGPKGKLADAQKMLLI